MLLDELDFPVPRGSIAQMPAEPRDSCRLMHLDREGKARHGYFTDLPSYLHPGDTLVINDSRVLPARLEAAKVTGGKVELLFLRLAPPPSAGLGETWEVLVRPSHRLRIGAVLVVPSAEPLILRERLGEGRWLIECPVGTSMVALMERHGRLPVPPYIRTYPADPSSYQTVYASSLGSAAAPTAGLHFTPELFERLGSAGIRTVPVTLHVGLDTFLPIRTQVVEEHHIHRETYSASREAVEVIRQTLASRDRLVAVGTTAVRVLETLAASGALDEANAPTAAAGSTDVFITPGYRFRAVDVMLTNFHLPRSTVLAMVMAFAGKQRIRRAYALAVDLGYRFFSFGDAMLIESPAAEEGRG